MALKILLGIWMSAVIVASFVFLPAAKGFMEPEAARMIVYHVPMAMISALSFILAMIYGIKYLRLRQLIDDAKSALAAELGLLFAVLATLTGSLFARVEWGSWWNWDPKETSIMILLLWYSAYFALRAAVEGAEKRASLSAAYSILAVGPMVLLMFVLPQAMSPLHPTGTLTSSAGLSNEYRMVLYPALIGFLGTYVWIFRLKTALAEYRLKQRS